MTDDEFVQWLQHGEVIVIGKQLTFDDLEEAMHPLPIPPGGAEATWNALAAIYDPCRAPRGSFCLYCPWERCLLK